MEKNSNPGFNVSAAIDALHHEALALGDEPTLGGNHSDPYFIATGHVYLHGVQANGVRCTKSPCQLGGACHALYELLEYQRESTSPRIHALLEMQQVTERAWADLRDHTALMADSTTAVLRSVLEQHHQEEALRSPGLLHDHALICERPLQIVQQMYALLHTLDDYAHDIRIPIISRELGQPVSLKPSALLLTAVYQHLHWGGFTYRRAGELVRDGVGGNPAGRVRSRVDSADARSILPRDVALSRHAEIAAHDFCS